MAFELGGLVCTCCGAPVTTTSGCHSFCACVGMSDKLQLQDVKLGLTFDVDWDVAGFWKADVTYSYPGGPNPRSGGTCPARTVTLHYNFDALCRVNVSWGVKIGTQDCPDDAADGGTRGFDMSAQIVVATSCTPFSGTKTFTIPNSPDAQIYGTGNQTWNVSSVYSSTDCCFADSIKGCTAFGIPGATAEYWTNSGKTSHVDGPNSAVGPFAISNAHTFGGGTYYYELTAPRHVTATGTAARACGGTYLTQLTPASGYACISNCSIPVSTTLFATHPVFGTPMTFTHNGTNWVSVNVISYPAYAACPAKSVTLTSTWTGAVYSESWKTVSDCPDDSGGVTVTATWGLDFKNCYDPTTFTSFYAQHSINPAGTAENNFYMGFFTQTIGLTE